jgi:hypothetical protein
MSDPPVSCAISSPPVALRPAALRRVLAPFARRDKVVTLEPRVHARDEAPAFDLLAGPEVDGPVSEPPRAERPAALALRFS